VRVTRNATGNVRRLNAAVVVNNTSKTDAKGKTTSVALTPEEIDKLTSLVSETIGFNKDRGDSVKVINAPFKVETIPTVDVPLWKQPETIDLLRSLAVPAGLGLVALLVFFGLLRPALKAALAPPPPPAAAAPGDALTAIVDDRNELPALPVPKSSEALDNARLLAKENPAAVAGIVRGWVNGETVAAKQGA
jgi:flagellar M-ring protein FliF